MRVSFLIPTRNNGRTIAAAVRSALAQTVDDLEVVVINDGSTDETRAVLDALADEDPRVRPLHTSPIGIVAAMNLGLAEARAAFVARLDGDDLARPGRVAAQLARLEADPSLAVVDGRVRLFRDDDVAIPTEMRTYVDWVNRRLEPDDFDREILVDSPVVHPASTYRRDEVRAIGGYRHGPFPEDYDLWLRLHAAGRRFAKVPEIVLDWRDHGARLTRNDPRYQPRATRVLRQGWLTAKTLSRPRRVLVWGADRAVAPWLGWLRRQGHHARAVPPQGALAGPNVEIGLVVAGTGRARDRARAEIAHQRPGWIEGVDWWAVR